MNHLHALRAMTCRISPGKRTVSPPSPTPAGILKKSSSARRPKSGEAVSNERLLRKVRIPQEISNPTPPAETTPPLSASKAATPHDRESVSPVGIRHGHRRSLETREAGCVEDLFENLVVHRKEQGFGPEKNYRSPILSRSHQHGPSGVINFLYPGHVHCLYPPRHQQPAGHESLPD